MVVAFVLLLLFSLRARWFLRLCEISVEKRPSVYVLFLGKINSMGIRFLVHFVLSCSTHERLIVMIIGNDHNYDCDNDDGDDRDNHTNRTIMMIIITVYK